MTKYDKPCKISSLRPPEAETSRTRTGDERFTATGEGAGQASRSSAGEVAQYFASRHTAAVRNTLDEPQPMHMCSLPHFAGSVHCFVWNLQEIPGLPFGFSCHSAPLCFFPFVVSCCLASFGLVLPRCPDLYHLLCPSARACLSRRVAASEHAVLAENSSAGCEVRQPLCGARQPRRSEPGDD